MNTADLRKLVRVLRDDCPARCTVIVPAAGTSSRFGKQNKLLADLNGETVLHATLKTLSATPEIHAIVVATREESISLVKKLAEDVEKVCAVVAGGATRTETVRAALEAVPKDTELVAVHDGARPLATPQMMGKIIRCAQRTGACIPVMPVRDTIKEVQGDCITRTPDRKLLFAAQTPQVFQKELLGAALLQNGDYTDDASAVEALGVCVRTLEGEYENIKITTQEDLALARFFLERRAAVCQECASDTATTFTD